MRFRIDLKIIFFLALFYFTHQLRLYLWTMLFCFIHEMGHLIIGVILGLKSKKIELMPYGFCLAFWPKKFEENRKKIITNILVAIAGPLTNFVIIIICFICLFLQTNFIYLDIIVYTNLIILLFNLLPIYPLDGGRVLHSILELICDKVKADIYTNKISNLAIIFLTMILSVVLYLFKNIAILVIIAYLWILTIKENKRFKIKMRTWRVLENIKN